MRRRDPNSRFARGMAKAAARNKAINRAEAETQKAIPRMTSQTNHILKAIAYLARDQYRDDEPDEAAHNCAMELASNARDSLDQLKARVAELENDGRNDKRLRGVVEHLRDISGFDPFRRDAFISAIRSARKALKGAGEWSGDIEDSTTKAAQTVQDLILKESDQLEAKTALVEALEEKHASYPDGFIAKFDRMQTHLRVYDRVVAWREAAEDLESWHMARYSTTHPKCDKARALDNAAETSSEKKGGS